MFNNKRPISRADRAVSGNRLSAKYFPARNTPLMAIKSKRAAHSGRAGSCRQVTATLADDLPE